jgi:hypothetical protein
MGASEGWLMVGWRLVGLAMYFALHCGGPVLAQDRAPNDSQLRVDRGVVADTLRDPQSAYFRATELRLQSDGSFLICGSVSGRNAYGGMGDPVRFYLSSGFEPSFVDSQSRYDLSPSSRQALFESRNAAWERLCSSQSRLVRRLDWNE